MPLPTDEKIVALSQQLLEKFDQLFGIGTRSQLLRRRTAYRTRRHARRPFCSPGRRINAMTTSSAELSDSD